MKNTLTKKTFLTVITVKPKIKHMKTLQLTTVEYYIFKQLAIDNNEMFVHSYNKETGMVEVVVSEMFCEAFGY